VKEAAKIANKKVNMSIAQLGTDYLSIVKEKEALLSDKQRRQIHSSTVKKATTIITHQGSRQRISHIKDDFYHLSQRQRSAVEKTIRISMGKTTSVG
jgi:hypothetical protein